MGSVILSGVYVAVLTPFKEDLSVDFDAFKWLIASLTRAGVDGVLISGTTGEWPSLKISERLKLVEAAREASGGRARILVGVMAGSAMETLEYAAAFRATDVDAVVATPPLYFRPSTRNLAKYFLSIAEASEKPLVLYTIPSHVGYNIPVETVELVAGESSLVVGIKATVDDLHYLHELVDRVKGQRRDFTVLAGYGEYLLEALAVGADGAIDAIANIVPGLVARVRDSWAQGRLDEAVKTHRILALLYSRLRKMKPIQSALKAALRELGAPLSGRVRPPLAEATEDQVNTFLREICRSEIKPYLLEGLKCG